jgi:ATP-dependent RNA helicase RhlB
MRPVDRPRKRQTRRRHLPVAWHPELFQVPQEEGKTRFHDLDLPDPVLHAVADAGFKYCTPIQAEIMPSTLKGRDAFGRAQTGTGKTAAFLITVLTRMLANPLKGKRPPGTPRVLIIAPTRELVLQIADEAHLLSAYCHFSIVSVFGGMDYEKQRRQLHGKPVDIVVATPGRLLDFKRRRDLDLKKVEMLILDEADRMLDMGFIPDVRQIVYSTPPQGQAADPVFQRHAHTGCYPAQCQLDPGPGVYRDRTGAGGRGHRGSGGLHRHHR